jgi:HPt (histidine-containing phosphotransfer) domain-containing protein
MMLIPDNHAEIVNMTEIPENLLWINDVKEISVPNGIRHSGGIGSFVFGLNLFWETIDDNARGINQAYKDGDFTRLTVKIRIVKTSAMLIGAVSLFEFAKKVEEACKNDDKIFVAANIDKLLTQYTAFKELLRRITNV